MKGGCETKDTRKRRLVELPVIGAVGPAESLEVAGSRTAAWRAAVLIALNVLMAIHIVQWLVSGTTLSPIEPSEAMYTLQRGAVNAGFIFFVLAIVATLVFGRFVCGWGCHIVALQDLCGWLLKKIGMTPRPFRSRLLMWVPLIVALYMFVWPTAARYFLKPPAEPLFPQFTNHLVTTEYWATFPPVAVAIPFLFICGFMTVYFLGQKGFCTYACPYGGFFGVADKLAPGKIRVTDACNQCGHCTATCTSNVLVHAEVARYGAVVDPGCMKCMDCVSVCPNDALYFGFGKPSVAVRKTPLRTNPLSWPEEIFVGAVFLASFMAVWDVYQLVPMLMALGIASVTTFLAYRLLRLFRTADSSFYRFNLRASGKIGPAGWVFAACAICWIGFNAHSGYVRYHENAGNVAFENIRIPDELALARTNPEPWLGPSDRRFVAEGQRHFNAAFRTALFTNVFALPKLAWIEYLSGDTERAVQLLELAATRQSGQARALSLYYRGAMLNRLGRHPEALASLELAIGERPDLIAAREERGEALWILGRRDEALSEIRFAVSQNPSLVLGNYILSGASATLGKADEAKSFEAAADGLAPADPFFQWMLGLRLQNVGMNDLADKRFRKAIEINPEFRFKRTFEPGR